MAPRGVWVHRLADFDRKALLHTAPPRLRVEEAVLDLAAEAPDELAAVQRVADAVQSRRTTAPRLRDAIRGRSRLSRRPFLLDVLDDVEEGACSVLEHGYLTRVERAHGLPVALRQAPLPARPGFSDVEYAPWGLVVELDGRLHHDHAVARDRDLDRDLDSAVAGRTTVRLGWGQVFRRPCATARRVGVLLRQRGWSGTLRACPSCRVRNRPALSRRPARAAAGAAPRPTACPARRRPGWWPARRCGPPTHPRHGYAARTGPARPRPGGAGRRG